MTLHYITNYVHIYFVHLGVWISFMAAVRIKDDKELNIKKIISQSLVLTALSAMSHNHFIGFLK
jgi:hypothetical protein